MRVMAQLAHALAVAAVICSASLAEANNTIDVVMYKTWDDRYSDCLTRCNENDLVPGVTFTWSKANFIDAEALEGKDVVMYPGGTGPGQIEASNVPDVLSFIKAGGGFYGTCGGAHTARLLDVMKDVAQEGTSVTGKANTRLSDWATRILGYGGDMMLSVYNGPGQYVRKGDIFAPLDYWHNNHRPDGTSRVGRANITNAEFAWPIKWDAADSGTRYMQSSADFYHKGRAMVHGAHPEMAPLRYPRRVCAGVAWAAGYDGLFKDYLLGHDTRHHSGLSDTAATQLIGQREHVSERGLLSSISVYQKAGKGRLIAGVYTGDERPLHPVAQSEPVSITQSGWTSVRLQEPYPVAKGQQIWLAVVFDNASQQIRTQRFPDKRGQTFEQRLWVSSARWSDLNGTTLPDLSSVGGIMKDTLASVYARVDFDRPKAHISADPYLEGCAPQAVALSAQGSAGIGLDSPIVSYRWDFADGSTGDQEDMLHSYEHAGTYTVRLTVTDRAGRTDSATKALRIAHCQDDGPTAYWKFDEGQGTAPLDCSGNNNHGLFHWREENSSYKYSVWPPVGPLWAEGVGSTGLRFPRAPEPKTGKRILNYLSVPHSPAVDLGTTDFTVNAWLRPEDLSNLNRWFSKHYWDSAKKQATNLIFDFGGTASYKFNFTYSRDKTTYRARSKSPILVANQWQMLTCVIARADSTMRIYRNGELVEKLPFSDDISKVDMSVPGDLVLGAHTYNPAFIGSMDEVRIYKRALEPGQVRQLFETRADDDPWETAQTHGSVDAGTTGSADDASDVDDLDAAVPKLAKPDEATSSAAEVNRGADNDLQGGCTVATWRSCDLLFALLLLLALPFRRRRYSRISRVSE